MQPAVAIVCRAPRSRTLRNLQSPDRTRRLVERCALRLPLTAFARPASRAPKLGLETPLARASVQKLPQAQDRRRANVAQASSLRSDEKSPLEACANLTQQPWTSAIPPALSLITFVRVGRRNYKAIPARQEMQRTNPGVDRAGLSKGLLPLRQKRPLRARFGGRFRVHRTIVQGRARRGRRFRSCRPEEGSAAARSLWLFR